jgi:hypothetical protein
VPPRPTPKFFSDVARAHLDALDRVAARGSPARLRRLYLEVLNELERESRGLLRGARGATFTAHHRRMILAQLRGGVRHLSQQLARQLTSVAREARAEGWATTLQTIGKLEEHYAGTTPALPIQEAARFVGVHRTGQRESLLRDASMHGLLPGRVQTSMARYGGRLITRFEDTLAKSLLRGETVGEAIDRVQEVGELEWWGAERIVRTECAAAFNGAQVEAITEAAHELDGLSNRWTEHVDDLTGAPLDNRVAADSMAMHGQVAAPGGTFVMPRDERVDSVRWGLRYSFPPNRPNDRATVMPWRPHWGIPAWRWDGERVPVGGER